MLEALRQRLGWVRIDGLRDVPILADLSGVLGAEGVAMGTRVGHRMLLRMKRCSCCSLVYRHDGMPSSGLGQGKDPVHYGRRYDDHQIKGA